MIEDKDNNDKNKEELTVENDSEKNKDNLDNSNIAQSNNINENENNVVSEEKIDNSTVSTETKESIDENVKEKEDDNVDINKDSKKEINEESEEKKNEDNDPPDAKWYIVGAASGFEEKASKTIIDNARKASLSKFFFDFQIPKQETVEIRRGKKINSEKKFFPGYMLIKMIMNNETWQLVKNSNKISGFVGNDHKPTPLSNAEAMKMLKKADDSIEYIAPKYVYEVGQQVKVIEGPFASFNGLVEEVDDERGRLKISVSIFGRSTPVELEYTQVEKV
tara:strand:- start:4255 stop:5088 length:834 start_codon:yes stop_codon:yes gene_type:complete